MDDELDKRYMRLALRLALKGAGRTSPNPMVGAVLVRDGKVIATGYHKQAGQDHAEIAALKRAGERARGATLYINLEPCSHQGRTPPCTLSLIRSGVARVVAGMLDPNPLVSGRGKRALTRAGIQVQIGFLEAECQKLNEAFKKHITRRTPFVILKLAATLDGRIATSTGESKWITGTAARRYVHRIRDQVDVILVGVGTVIADDPELTCRVPKGRDPWRVVLDSHLRVPLSAHLLHHPEPEKTIIVTGTDAPSGKTKIIRGFGNQVWTFKLRAGGIPFGSILKRLGAMNFLSVLIEGGANTASRALKEKAVDKLLLFYAPKIIGGDGRPMVDSLGVKKMKQCAQVTDMAIKSFGSDFLISGYLKSQ